MKLGEIIEMGKHQELQALGGLYAEMWSKQQATGGDWDANSGLKSQAASVNNLLALAAAAPGPSAAAPPAAAASSEIQPDQSRPGHFHGHRGH